MFRLHIERCTFLHIDISFLLELSVRCSRLWSFVCCDASWYACPLKSRVICSFFLVCTLKVLALTIVCITTSCKPLFAAWSSFLLPGIPVLAGIQLIVGLYATLDAASGMALVIKFKSSFLLFSMFIAVRDYVCIVILSLVSQAFSSPRRMAVISTSSTDAES